MSVWFEGEGEVDCSIQHVARALEDPGGFFAGVVALMPGLASVELLEQRGDTVIIATSEGRMERSNVATRVDGDSVVVDFDEQYQAGSKVTTNAHFSEKYVASAGGVTHRLVVTGLEAPGFLGFFYRKFGSSKMGAAFLTATRAYLESQAD